MRAFLSSSRWLLLCVTVVLFGSLFVTRGRLTWPGVIAGDEPHYLLMLNSVVVDGDLDLRNNYRGMHQGSTEAGRDNGGLAMAHHSSWYVGDQRIHWGRAYDRRPEHWLADDEGHRQPVFRPELAPELRAVIAHQPEYSTHPFGWALLVAPFVWPARGTPWVEPLAAALSTLAVLLCIAPFRMLARRYAPDEESVNVATLVAFLCTPIWIYAHTLFNEPYLALFFLAAYALALRRDSAFWPGVWVGLGVWMKPVFLIVLAPLALRLLVRRDVRGLARMAVGPVIAVGVFLYANTLMYGAPLRSPQSFRWGDPFTGAFWSLLEPSHGVLMFCPIAAAMVPAWRRLLRTDRADSWTILGGVALYTVLFFFYDNRGGYCPGPRYQVPVFPAAMVAAVALPEMFKRAGGLGKLVLVALALGSFAANALVVVFDWWSRNPGMQVLRAWGLA